MKEDTIKQSDVKNLSSSNKLQETVNQMQGEELFKRALSLIAQNNYTEALPILRLQIGFIYQITMFILSLVFIFLNIENLCISL